MTKFNTNLTNNKIVSNNEIISNTIDTNELLSELNLLNFNEEVKNLSNTQEFSTLTETDKTEMFKSLSDLKVQILSNNKIDSYKEMFSELNRTRLQMDIQKDKLYDYISKHSSNEDLIGFKTYKLIRQTITENKLEILETIKNSEAGNA